MPPIASLSAGIAGLPLEHLVEGYRKANPFPHLVVDDLLPEADALALELACRQASTPVNSSNGFTQAGKTTLNDWRLMPAPLLEACALFNSGPVVEWLEAITRLEGLIADPHLEGGGLHRTARGGFLKLHTDFNWNPRLRLHRRLNVLYYLNSGYQSAWGGQLLLTRQPAEHTLDQMVAIEPRFNRLVWFNTNDTTFHGQPIPHAFPPERVRISLAFYYYTASSAPLQERWPLRCSSTRYLPALDDPIDSQAASIRSRLSYWIRRWTPFA